MTTTLTPAPTNTPSRDRPATFAADANALLSWMPGFVTEVNSLMASLGSTVDAATSAVQSAGTDARGTIQPMVDEVTQLRAAAALSEAQAAISAAAASLVAGKWSAATAYAEGGTAWSPSNYRTYRRKTAGTSATDPANDPVNWVDVVLSQRSLHNRFINGDHRVSQRGTGTIASAQTSGTTVRATDMWSVKVTGSPFNVIVDAGPTGMAASLRLQSTASGNITYEFTTRIESINAADLAAKITSISAMLYHDTAAARNVDVLVQSPATADDWSSALTTEFDSADISVASGVWSPLAWQSSALGAGVARGVSVTFRMSAVTTGARSVYLTAAQLELGNTATPFDVRPFALEQLLCRRYLPAFSGAGMIGNGYSYQSGGTFISVSFDVPTRVPVTGVIVTAAANFTLHNGAGAVASPTGLAFNIGGTTSCDLLVTSTTPATSAAQPARLSGGSGARILFTGAEL